MVMTYRIVWTSNLGDTLGPGLGGSGVRSDEAKPILLIL